MYTKYSQAEPARTPANARGETRSGDAYAQLGAGRELTFAAFQAAVANYQVGVVRGSQTMLRDAADAYAAYLAAFIGTCTVSMCITSSRS